MPVGIDLLTVPNRARSAVSFFEERRSRSLKSYSENAISPDDIFKSIGD